MTTPNVMAAGAKLHAEDRERISSDPLLKKRFTPLELAAVSGVDIQTMKACLQENKYLNQVSSKSFDAIDVVHQKSCALHYVCSWIPGKITDLNVNNNSLLQVTRRLIDQQIAAIIFGQSPESKTLLAFQRLSDRESKAAFAGRLGIINALDSNGVTPLMVAVSNNPIIAKLLLSDYSANFMSCDRRGLPVIGYAALYCDSNSNSNAYTQNLRQLLDKGATPFSANAITGDTTLKTIYRALKDVQRLAINEDADKKMMRFIEYTFSYVSAKNTFEERNPDVPFAAISDSFKDQLIEIRRQAFSKKLLGFTDRQKVNYVLNSNLLAEPTVKTWAKTPENVCATHSAVSRRGP